MKSGLTDQMRFGTLTGKNKNATGGSPGQTKQASRERLGAGVCGGTGNIALLWGRLAWGCFGPSCVTTAQGAGSSFPAPPV